MADLFDRLGATLLGKEGGYVNDPNDRGGETIWGITVAVARAFGYSRPMREMTRDEALQIYRKRYWEQPGFDRLAQIDEALAERLFDIGVNMGTAVAGKMLQRALNVLNRQAADYPDIAVDGACGAMTRAALGALIAKRGSAGRAVILGMVKALHSVRYIEIAEGNASQEAYEFGWQANRALAG
jgi:lysozyme family protein